MPIRPNASAGVAQRYFSLFLGTKEAGVFLRVLGDFPGPGGSAAHAGLIIGAQGVVVRVFVILLQRAAALGYERHYGGHDHNANHQMEENSDIPGYSGALVVSASACNSPSGPSILPFSAA